MHALRDVINFDTLHHRKYIAVNREASNAPNYVEKMATENGGSLVFVFCTFCDYFKVIAGINVRNRFVYVG